LEIPELFKKVCEATEREIEWHEHCVKYYIERLEEEQEKLNKLKRVYDEFKRNFDEREKWFEGK